MLSSEMSAPFDIYAISMKNYSTSSQTQQHVNIWMGDTDLDILTNTFDANYNPGTKTLVFDQDDVLTGGTIDEWFLMYLDTPFQYDGQHNLIIDLESSYCNTIYVWGWDTSSLRNLYTYSNGSSTGILNSPLPHLQIHGVLELERCTFGEIKSSF